MRRTLVAMYDDLVTARNVIDELIDAGFDRADVGLATYDESGEGYKYIEAKDVKADEGASFGALVGGLTGLVAGLAAITIPGIGPIIAAGPLTAALGGAAGAALGAGAGAATGGLTAALVGMGVPDEEATTYMEGIRRGGALVTANVPEEKGSLAIEVMNRFSPIDLSDRTRNWAERGWQGWNENTSPYTREELEKERALYRSNRTTASTGQSQAVRSYNYSRDE